MHIIYNESERRLESFHRSCSYFPAMLCSALPSSDERTNERTTTKILFRSLFFLFHLLQLGRSVCFFNNVLLWLYSCCSFFPFVLFCIYFVSVFVFGCIYIYAIALVCLAVVANNEWLEFLIVCLRYDGDGAECSFFFALLILSQSHSPIYI